VRDRRPVLSITRKDCKWDYYVGSGKGGQKRNKTANCVRCTHEPSGAVGKAEDGRSQWHNKKSAFLRMSSSKRFLIWVKIETSRKLGIEAEIEAAAERSMRSQNLHVDVKNERGLWVPEEASINES